MKPGSLARSLSMCLASCAAILLATQARAEVFREDFNDNSIDPTVWTAYVFGSGPQIADVHQQLEISIPRSSSDPDVFGCKLASSSFSAATSMSRWTSACSPGRLAMASEWVWGPIGKASFRTPACSASALVRTTIPAGHVSRI